MESALNQTAAQTSTVEESFKQELRSEQDKNYELRRDLDQAQAALADFKAQLSSLQTKLVKNDKELTSAHARNCDLRRDVEQLQHTNAALRDDLTKADEKVAFNGTLLEKWQRKWQDSAKLIDSTQRRNTELETKFKRTFDELEGADRKLRQAQNRVAALEEELRRMDDKLARAADANKEELQNAVRVSDVINACGVSIA